jgi:hypothetical protein
MRIKIDYEKAWKSLKAENGYRWCQPNQKSFQLRTIFDLMSSVEKMYTEKLKRESIPEKKLIKDFSWIIQKKHKW